jgi:hypothetical protein
MARNAVQKLKGILQELTPPILRRAEVKHASAPPPASLVLPPEELDYHALASRYALHRLTDHGILSEMKLLCCTARMPHLADYAALLGTVYHSSMLETRWPPSGRRDPIFFHGDFFDLEPLPVDCVISHTTMHCVSDTRYGNEIEDGKSPMVRPYLFPAQLRSIVGDRSVPTFVTVAVNREERDWENNRWLSHEGVLKCFAASGFNLQDYYFDYMTGGCTNPDRFRPNAYRQAKELPPPSLEGVDYVVGTYYFT